MARPSISSQGDSTNNSYLLLAHMDVVPVDEDHWTNAPFAGSLDDGRVTGRGALDDKLSVVVRCSFYLKKRCI